ncbi:hypothetical protein [Streptomyces sp. NPDC020298]|uniref:hypothetical protein n=1 Tax=unclassified Streptomyces TaxID=2593676 RepID=UPI0033FE3C8C
MPAKPAQEPEPERAPVTTRTTETEAPKPAKAEVDDVPEDRLPAGVYEFVGTVPTQYLEVPLTARPAAPGRDATDDEAAVLATPATVFDWPVSAPGDGRWKPTKKKPNQQPDNAPADPEGE